MGDLLETAAAEDILSFCKGQLTHFFLPKEIVFLKELPKSIVGKVLKKKLREMQ